jgi:N-carbamoylputrescine amidase
LTRKKVKVAGIQMACKPASKKENIKKAINYIEKAAEDGANIILLQELFSVEYTPFGKEEVNIKIFDYAEEIPGPTTDKISEKAKQHNIYIISPIYEKTLEGEYYNSAPLINPDGKILGVYRKTHVGRRGEKIYFKPGSEFNVYKTEFGKIGILICRDKSFPEPWRILTLKGADIIFHPAAIASIPNPLAWEPMIRIRAIDNNIFIVSVNRVGQEEDYIHFGGSVIVGPKGEVIARAGREEGIISATIDLNDITNARKEWQVLKDLRPEIYGRISKR